MENYRSPANPEARFLVGTGDLWLPKALLRKRAPATGDVFRIKLELFNRCLAFREGSLERSRFLEATRRSAAAVEHSLEETHAFARWHEQQVEEARGHFFKSPESVLKRLDANASKPGSGTL